MLFWLVIDIVFFRQVHWIGLGPVSVPYPGLLTLKAPAKVAYENVVCLSCLLHIFATIIDLCKFRGKMCGSKSACSYRNSIQYLPVYTDGGEVKNGRCTSQNIKRYPCITKRVT